MSLTTVDSGLISSGAITLTTQVTGTLPVANGGSGVTTSTGTGAVVLGTSPTLTTPTISTITSAAATALTLQSASTTAVTIDTSQNVGIGTTTPTGRLHVRWDAGAGDGYTGKSIFSTTDQALFIKTYWQSGTGQHTTLEASNLANSALTDLRSNGATLQFLTGSTERMRIDASGNLLVAGTSFNANGSVCIGPIGPSANGCTAVSTSTTATNIWRFYNGNGNVGTISISGSATSYATSSDYRLKNTIAPMTGALAKVALLKPCTYKWNADNSDGQGFIAHELQAVEPGCVSGEKDAVDTDGNPQYQGIDTSFLVATLTAAIQEQQALIIQLQADVAALKR